MPAPQVSKLVHAIKMGWIKPRKPKEDTPTYYDLWAHEDPNSILGRHKMHVPAPKMKLPGHEESYNPPPEYLLSEEEVGGVVGAVEKRAGGTRGAAEAAGPQQGCAEGGQPGVLGHQRESRRHVAMSGGKGSRAVAAGPTSRACLGSNKPQEENHCREQRKCFLSWYRGFPGSRGRWRGPERGQARRGSGGPGAGCVLAHCCQRHRQPRAGARGKPGSKTRSGRGGLCWR